MKRFITALLLAFSLSSCVVGYVEYPIDYYGYPPGAVYVSPGVYYHGGIYYHWHPGYQRWYAHPHGGHHRR